MPERVSSGNIQFLTFILQDELFALDITIVREVLQYTHITRVPRTDPFLRGIINVRGNAVPVIDLNMKFGKPQTERTINACIIIVEVEVEGETTTIGALADSVQEVYDIQAERIDTPPSMGTSIRSEYIRGMARHGESFIMILDVNQVFSHRAALSVN